MTRTTHGSARADHDEKTDEQSEDGEPRERDGRGRVWTEVEITGALTLYASQGLAAAHRITGVPKSTLRDWARDRDVNPAAITEANRERMLAANAARMARCEAMRLELRESLLVEAQWALERIHRPYVEYVGQQGKQVTFEDGPPARECSAFMTTAAIAIDKYRLEMGESTSRDERISMNERASRVAAVRDELAARRARAA